MLFRLRRRQLPNGLSIQKECTSSDASSSCKITVLDAAPRLNRICCSRSAIGKTQRFGIGSSGHYGKQARLATLSSSRTTPPTSRCQSRTACFRNEHAGTHVGNSEKRNKNELPVNPAVQDRINIFFNSVSNRKEILLWILN